MRNLALLSTLTLLGTLLPQPASAAIIYRSNEGWSVEGDASSKVESSAAEQMRKAEEYERAGNEKAALNSYKVLVKQFGLSALAPKAQRKIGVILEKNGEVDKAFDAYSAYLEKYPRGEDFDSVVESMFKIAKMFLDGQKTKKLLGVSFGGSVERAEQMFTTLLKRAPYSKWAPVAQFNIGQAHERQGKYPEAIAAYQAVVSRYPTDAIADDAQYQMGYVLLREYREGSYDRASAQKAREAFEDFVNRYPDSEKVPQARENMATLEGGSTRGSLDIAKFYEKTKNYKAAVIYYNDVIKRQPDSPESGLAKARIEELKEKYGEDSLRAGPEKAETGAKAATRRKMQARVDTVSRPDYVGPPVKIAATRPPESAPAPSPGRPRLRTSPETIEPMSPDDLPLPSKTEPPADANASKPEAVGSKPGE
jgi:outer membrane protein assembly factor BamD